MNDNTEKIQLKIPEQDLKKFSFSSHNPKKFNAWVDTLPLFNIDDSSIALLDALGELVRLKVDENIRLKLLQILYPRVDYICKSLGKNYLNKPLVLPEYARNSANLAQLLQSHMALAYKVVVVHTATKANNKEYRPILCSAIERSMYYLTKNLMRCYQLYVSTPTNFWREFHRLYLLAEQEGLVAEKVPVETYSGNVFSSIEHIYKKTLMLTAARPNQLRQKEIEALFQILDVWVNQVEISAEHEATDVFCINLLRDMPPFYVSALSKRDPVLYRRFIQTTALAAYIRDHLNGAKLSATAYVTLDTHLDDSHKKPEKMEVPTKIGKDLLGHIKLAWGKELKRQYMRTKGSGEVKLAGGLIASHFFLGNQIHFQDILTKLPVKLGNLSLGPKASKESLHRTVNYGSEESVDYDLGANWASEESVYRAHHEDVPEYKYIDSKVVNISEMGYCLAFQNEEDSQIKPGELVAVSNDQVMGWQLGVVRWMEQFKQKGAQVGVQIIGKRVISCAVKSLPKKGTGSEYLRAFLTVAAARKSSSGVGVGNVHYKLSIIIPNLNYFNNSKTILRHLSEDIEIMLGKEIMVTQNFTHYEISFEDEAKYIKALLQDPNEIDLFKEEQGGDQMKPTWVSL